MSNIEFRHHIYGRYTSNKTFCYISTLFQLYIPLNNKTLTRSRLVFIFLDYTFAIKKKTKQPLPQVGSNNKGQHYLRLRPTPLHTRTQKTYLIYLFYCLSCAQSNNFTFGGPQQSTYINIVHLTTNLRSQLHHITRTV